jgi:hypothetical protein
MTLSMDKVKRSSKMAQSMKVGSKITSSRAKVSLMIQTTLTRVTSKTTTCMDMVNIHIKQALTRTHMKDNGRLAK